MDTKELIKDYIINTLRKKIDLEIEMDYETPLVQRGVINSILIIDLVLFLEATFKVHIHPSEVTRTNFHSVNTIQDFIREKGGC